MRKDTEKIAQQVLGKYYSATTLNVKENDDGSKRGMCDFVLVDGDTTIACIEVTRLANNKRIELEKYDFSEICEKKSNFFFELEISLSVGISSSDFVKKAKSIFRKIKKERSSFYKAVDAIENDTWVNNAIKKTGNFIFNFSDIPSFHNGLNRKLQNLERWFLIDNGINLLSSIYLASCNDPHIIISIECQSSWKSSDNVVDAINMELVEKDDNCKKLKKYPYKEKHLFFVVCNDLLDVQIGMKDDTPGKLIHLPDNADITDIWVCTKKIGTKNQVLVWRYYCNNSEWDNLGSFYLK